MSTSVPVFLNPTSVISSTRPAGEKLFEVDAKPVQVAKEEQPADELLLHAKDGRQLSVSWILTINLLFVTY